MKTAAIWLVMMVLNSVALAEAPAATGAISFGDYAVVHQRDCFDKSFGDYEEWREMLIAGNKQLDTEAARDEARARFAENFPAVTHEHYKNNLHCQWFVYSVDGGQVRGYVVKPKNATGKLPVLIYNRGGNLNFGGVFFGHLFKRQFPYADAGFIVIGSQYRGTFFREPDPEFSDQFGGDDVNDVLELLKIIGKMPNADASRVGMVGHSRGAMQTFLALRNAEPGRVKAIAALAGNYDLPAGLEDRPEMEEVYRARIPQYEERKEQALAERSALNWVDELDESVPILLLHGQDDWRVNPVSSLQMALALQETGVPYRLTIYPKDDHSFSKHREEVNETVVDWFKAWL